MIFITIRDRFRVEGLIFDGRREMEVIFIRCMTFNSACYVKMALTSS